MEVIKPEITLKKKIEIGYYLISYVLIIAFSGIIIYQNGIKTNLLELIQNKNYYNLTIVSVSYLIIDFFYKYFTSNKNKLYYALQVHHVIGIFCYILSYLTGIGQSVVTNLSMFEISSIPLVFYSEKIYTSISLPLTWLSYLFVRIIFGNYLLFNTIYQLYLYQDKISIIFLGVSHIACWFFIFANNYWFYLLTKSMYKNRMNLAKIKKLK